MDIHEIKAYALSRTNDSMTVIYDHFKERISNGKTDALFSLGLCGGDCKCRPINELQLQVLIQKKYKVKNATAKDHYFVSGWDIIQSNSSSTMTV